MASTANTPGSPDANKNPSEGPKPSGGTEQPTSQDAVNAQRGIRNSSSAQNSPDSNGPDNNGPDSDSQADGDNLSGGPRAAASPNAKGANSPAGKPPSDSSRGGPDGSDDSAAETQPKQGVKAAGTEAVRDAATKAKDDALKEIPGGTTGAALNDARKARKDQDLDPQQQKKARNAALLKAGEEGAKEVAQKFGVPKAASDKVIKVAKILVPIVFAAFVFLGMAILMVILGGSLAQPSGSAKVKEVIGNQTLAEQSEAAAAYGIPEGVIWGLSLAATENGKFSPYSDDSIDRAPLRDGVRRPSAGAAPGTGLATMTPVSSGGATTSAVTPTTVALAAGSGAATPGRAVTMVGDSLCESGVEPVYRKALTDAGNSVVSYDCKRGRPLAGAGVQAVTAATQGASTVLVSLGTNDLGNDNPAKFGADVEGLLAANPSANFVWYNFSAPKFASAAGSYNAELARIAAANPRLVVADMAAAVTANPGLQAADGVHLVPSAYNERARIGAAAVSGASGGSAPRSGGVWPANPAGVEVSDYPVVKPPIGADGKASGPYLIQPRLLAQYPDLKVQDFRFSGRRNTKTSTDLVARELSSIRDRLVRQGWKDDPADVVTQRKLWVEAVSRLAVSDPRLAECRVPDPGPPAGDPALNQVTNAQLISQVWFCEISKATAFTTLTGVSKTGDKFTDVLGASDAAATVVQEAVQVSWAYSKWGTEACDATTAEAGMFPLTAEVFDAYALAEDKIKGRCDTAANTRAAVRAFIAGEQVQPGQRSGVSGSVGDRTDEQGPFAPMLGGWRAMPAALGGPAGIEEFAKRGPAVVWRPAHDSACSKGLDQWVAAAAANPINASGTEALVDLQVCDSPGGGGLSDPLYVAELRARVTSARSAVAAAGADTNPDAESGTADTGWDCEVVPGSDPPDRSCSRVVPGASLDPDAESADNSLGGGLGGATAADFAAQAANLDGVLAALGAVGVSNVALPAVPRVTHTGAAPADMPVFMLVASDPTKLTEAASSTAVASAAAGTASYASIVVQVAENLGGLVPGWYGDEKTEDPPETKEAVMLALAPLKALAPAAPAGFPGGAGTLGNEIPYAAIFNAKGAQYGIDPRFLASVAWAESGYTDANVYCTNKSRAGALGLMQFMPATAKSFGIDPCVPEQAVDGSARFYKQLYEKYSAWDLSLAAYNAGPGRVNPCMCVPAIKETQAYVVKVMKHWEELKVTYPDQLPVGPQLALGGGSLGGGVVPGGYMVETFNRGPMCVVKVPAGITVNCEIASAFQQMVDLAAGQGARLGGSSYRDYQGQLAVRRNNCGTSMYAIYEMPSSSCSPPSAKPGNSQHELGLAIDLTCSGSLITRRSGPCWDFLAANAGAFGFKNLPSEPWHWSTTGR
jgi:soluble lytic murein transglycosylase-like protein